MFEWLHSLPNVVIGLIFVVVGMSVTTLVPFLVRKKFELNPSEHFGKGTEEAFKIFTSLTLMLLAFCLVRVQGDHRNAEDLSSREGVIIHKLSRSLQHYASPESDELQAVLLNYSQRIATVEWPLLAKGQRDEETTLLLGSLVQRARSLQTNTPAQQITRNEIIGILTQLSDVRDARLSASHLELPFYYYQALSFSVVALIFFGWFQSPLPKMAAYVGGVTLAVSLLLTMLFVTSTLFLGESQVTPEAINRAIMLMNSKGS